jgi:hypothetical protein
MQATKPLRKESKREKGHTCDGEQTKITGRFPLQKAIAADSLPVLRLNLPRWAWML